jgi:tRNA uridine 5-carboxymethylaminomethyl modification enzyme
MFGKYDVIVVGGGHAGCEAAAAAANLGSKTLLISMDMTKFGQMSCNPAMGGIAKGQIVREIDALGGYSGIVTDLTTIQFRMLNKSKGPAMWSPRAQCDRVQFSIEWRKILENLPNLDFWQDNVIGLLFEDNKVIGVKTQLNIEFRAQAVVVTTGTFLNGLMHVGKAQTLGGRVSEPNSVGITEQLVSMGFSSGRMKTGTPARIDGRSIDFASLTRQEGDSIPGKFSFLPEIKPVSSQMPCFMAYTSTEVHDVLRSGLKDSPMYDGTIKSIGPRYCPSIETKIVTFADKDHHLLFLEPEGWNTNEYYINGFSSSLPYDVQFRALRTIKGLENVKIFRPGYAIEYDFFEPTQLKHSLETKAIASLFFAGQINGTTGYEEAAAQGLIAGINAHQIINGLPSFTLKRDEAYIGVLIDDLVTKGVDEPYRMFTSRAEYRVLLRQDNADQRLTCKSYDLGLASLDRMNILNKKNKCIKDVISFTEGYGIRPDFINTTLAELNSAEISQITKLKTLLLRPQVCFDKLIQSVPDLADFVGSLSFSSSEVLEEAEILIKYSGYIERERLLADKITRLEYIDIYEDFDYNKLSNLSTEARQKLSKIKPKTIGQASRIPGVSPSDISVLLVFFGR